MIKHTKSKLIIDPFAIPDRLGGLSIKFPFDFDEIINELSIPLKDLEVLVSIENSCACIVVRQTYVNDGYVFNELHRDDIMPDVEAIFMFPVHPSSAIYAMRVVIGQRVIVSEVCEKRLAEEKYEQAVKEGHTAGLLKQKSRDLLQVFLGNLKYKEEVKVEIRYVCELSFVRVEKSGIMHDVLQFTLPMAISPRYSASPIVNLTELPKYSTHKKIEYRFRLFALVYHSGGVKNMWSSSHPLVEIKKVGKGMQMNTYSEPLDQDFVLCILPNDIVLSTPISCVIEWNRDWKSIATSVTMLATTEDKPVNTGDYVIVVDCSGSMMGEKINAAKLATSRFIAGLPNGSMFGIVAFAYKPAPFSKILLSVDNADTRREAQKFIAELKADGGTETLKALEEGYQILNSCESEKWKPSSWKPLDGTSIKENRQTSRRPKALLLITDGEIELIDKTVSSARKAVDDGIKTFVIGIGHSIGHGLIESVARAGSGISDTVFPEDGGSINSKVSLMLLRMLSNPAEVIQPKIFNTPSSWGNCTTISNNRKSLLYPGMQLTEYNISTFESLLGLKSDERIFSIEARYRKNKEEEEVVYKTTVTLPIDGKYGIMTVDLHNPNNFYTNRNKEDMPFDDGWLHRLAALRRIRDLEDNVSGVIPIKTVRDDIKSLGLKYNLVTSETSLFYIDEKNVSQNKRKKIFIPVLMPRGEPFLVPNTNKVYSAPPDKSSFKIDQEEQNVIDLLNLQNHDGSWSCEPPTDSIKENITLITNYLKPIVTIKNLRILATTLAFLYELSRKYQKYFDIWIHSSNKADNFIDLLINQLVSTQIDKLTEAFNLI